MKVVWRQDGTGEKWALVLLGRWGVYWASLDSYGDSSPLPRIILNVNGEQRGSLQFAHGSHGDSGDEILYVSWADDDPDTVWYSHHSIANLPDPIYSVGYKDHSGNNKYLYLDRAGHVVSWNESSPLS
jgi:hypothetical protein